jgi:flagellar hook protein FlgE
VSGVGGTTVVVTRASDAALFMRKLAAADDLARVAGIVRPRGVARGGGDLARRREERRSCRSNVDVSTELTAMIESQSVYTANSKVFTTGNEMLDSPESTLTW